MNNFAPFPSIIEDICRPLGKVLKPVFADLVTSHIRNLLAGGQGLREVHGLVVDQAQSNGLWCVKQLRVTLPNEMGTYRIIIAPADAPVFIGSVPADEHFAEPLLPQAAE